MIPVHLEPIGRVAPVEFSKPLRKMVTLSEVSEHRFIRRPVPTVEGFGSMSVDRMQRYQGLLYRASCKSGDSKNFAGQKIMDAVL